MRYTTKNPINRCRDWMGARDGAGYACVSMRDTNGERIARRVYRVIVEALSGPIPPGYHVHHTCGNPSCVNPDHLQRSDARSNIGEMLTRMSYVRYIAALRAALTELDPSHPLLTPRIDTYDGTVPTKEPSP